MQKKAAKVGFDWDTVEPALAKLKEEITELEEQIEAARSGQAPLRDNAGIEEEVGDLLFSAINVSRHLKADPSVALAHTNNKFLSRFQYVEERVAAQHKAMSDLPLEKLDHFWNEAKEQERQSKADNE